jgi:hypothetical protein
MFTHIALQHVVLYSIVAVFLMRCGRVNDTMHMHVSGFVLGCTDSLYGIVIGEGW